MAMKRPHVAMYVRLPPEMKKWLKERAAQSFANGFTSGSQNAEVIRCIREQMEAERRTSQGRR